MKSICCRFKVTLSSRLLLHSKFRLFLSGFLLFTSPSLLPVLASGNRGSLYHHPTSRGYVSGPCAALQSFLAGILPCVDFACGFLALLICWHVVHPLCPGNSQCSTEWSLPGVWSFSPATAESQLLLALGWGLPILYCGHPHPHPYPPTNCCLIVPSTLPFPSLGTMGIVGAGGSLRPLLSLVLTCCHSYPFAAALCCHLAIWRWLLHDFVEEVGQKYLLFSDPET